MKSNYSAAFSLIEVSLALGIVAFCIPSIVALLSVGMNSNQISGEQITETGILTAVNSDLRAAPFGATMTSEQFNISIPSTPIASTQSTIYLTREGKIVTSAQDARYLVTVTFLSSANSGGGNNAMLADIKVSWPAILPPSNATGMVESLVALNRN